MLPVAIVATFLTVPGFADFPHRRCGNDQADEAVDPRTAGPDGHRKIGRSRRCRSVLPCSVSEPLFPSPLLDDALLAARINALINV
jgi:hypothetical protein